MGFREIAALYLEYSYRRHAEKTARYKNMVYRNFKEYLEKAYQKEDIEIESITPQMIHEYLNTRPSNNNYNAHRKDMSALFSFARRQLKIPVPNPMWDIDMMPVKQAEKEIAKAQHKLERETRRAEEQTRRAQERAARAARRAQEKVARKSRKWGVAAETGPTLFGPPPPPHAGPPKPQGPPAEEQLAVLKMLQEKKISPAEAEMLLRALEG